MSSSCDQTKGPDACGDTAAQHGGDSECCNMPEKLLCLADEAWKEVVKEKIKKEIEKNAGAKLDALAKLVAEGNHKKWSYLIEGKQQCDQFKDQVKEALVSLSK
jgi:hypothetical protein